MEARKKNYIKPDNFGCEFKNRAFTVIYGQTTKDFQKLVTLEQFTEMATSFNSGVECYQLESRTSLTDYVTQYLWLDDRREKEIRVSFDANDTILSLFLGMFVSYPESDRNYTKNTYTMPIKDEWIVVWGGINEFLNYHYVHESQRYAYDLVMIKEGQFYKDSTNKNENYYAFNRDIVAPADGKVMKVLEGIEDNVPGEMNPSQPEGNCVIIEHENNEYSLLAHLKQNSIVVNVGQVVKQGQLIGLCGNSGNSSEPHLHFQVMNTSDYLNGQSIRIRFSNDLEPIQGDLVSPTKIASS
ncbi:M23 family metallopeptidase [Lysinibacillus sp. NPDC097287]|uniref:M23 family metallopeptidase n=1 Tax=Lysinibacillus sp. NPDC097287 TaxID=3364144 RepID=UPI003818130D